MNIMNYRVWSIILLIAWNGIGCRTRPDEMTDKLATDAAQTWVALIDEARYEDSWEQSASLFRASLTKENWKNLVTPVRSPLGAVHARTADDKEFSTTLPGCPDGSYVTVRFSTSFENKREAVETTVVALDGDGKWRVAGYFIQ